MIDAAVVGRDRFLAQFGPAAPAGAPPARPPTVPAVELTPEQQAAVERIVTWFSSPDGFGSAGGARFMTLGGLAGSGKSTVVDHLNRLGFARIIFLAPTGKAVHVLRGKGVPAQTIHSFRYDYSGRDEVTGKLLFELKDTAKAALLVVDEASMVTTDVHRDLLEAGIRILYVGDFGQLAPVGSDPGLMRDPDVKLETVMRQSLESPILRFAHAARTYRPPVPVQEPGLLVRGTNWYVKQPDSWLGSFDVVMVCFNATRVTINSRIRQHLGRKSDIEVGERLICLRNERSKGLFNGMIVSVSTVHRNGEIDVVTDEGRPIYNLMPCREQLGNPGRVDLLLDRRRSLFDYGYAITVHKGQGSQWDRVLVVEEYSTLFDIYRLRYTAATRAVRELVYVTNDCPDVVESA